MCSSDLVTGQLRMTFGITELMRLITRATLNSNGRDGSLAHEVLDPEVPQLSETGLLLVEDGSVFLVENGAYMKLG